MKFQEPTFAFSTMSDAEIEKLLREYKIGLTVDEARKIETILSRPPTLTEAVIWGIQGSEHCSYKSSRKYIKTLPTEAPQVILGPVEDSGIVEIARTGDGDRYGIVISHESHNHPSQVVPYEGAATGIGGCVRDVACMGAKVIGTLDALRFGNTRENEWCRIVAENVVNGIGGYGNPIGVPNFGGDVYFDDSFNDNCLVNAITIGLIKESEIIHSYVPPEAAKEGWDIIVVGKPTDNSGMGGAAFSSMALDEDDREANKGAVQEPNAFLKRHLLASTYDLFRKLHKENLLAKVSMKDMGAGGNMCASVEMVANNDLGAEIDLEKIHVAIDNLQPSVIACSETQERFCWMCHPNITQMILEHYNKVWELPKAARNARASKVGKVKEGNYVLKYQGSKVCDAGAKDITEGLRYDRPFHPPKIELNEPELPDTIDLQKTLLRLLSSENIASRECVYERYDKTVQGITAVDAGFADAGVLAPLIDETDENIRYTGVAVKADGNARYGRISPYWQSANAVCEVMRNVAATGAVPRALTDCLNYGNPEKPEQMWELVEGIRGLREAAPIPYISGNASLYNESKDRSINPSAIVACIGVMPDYRKALRMQLRKAGSLLFLIGIRQDECGGSEYYRLFGQYGMNVPQPDFTEAQNQIAAVTDAANAELLLSCHDISEGGLAVSMMEMAMYGDIAFDADITAAGNNLSTDKILFSETGGFICEVPAENENAFIRTCEARNIAPVHLGTTTTNNTCRFVYAEKEIINIPLSKAKKAWHESLRPYIFG